MLKVVFSSAKVNTTAQVEGLTSVMTCCRIPMTLASSLYGLTEQQKSIRAKSIVWLFVCSSQALNLLLQSAVGILISFRPGVSIKLNVSNPLNKGSCVTPRTSYDSSNAFELPNRFMKVDLPVPRVPSTITVGFYTGSTI